MSTQNLCLRAKIRKKCIPLYTPSFTIYKWDVGGYKSHGHVIMMNEVNIGFQFGIHPIVA